jgi:hypothetical protein
VIEELPEAIYSSNHLDALYVAPYEGAAGLDDADRPDW